MSEGDRYTGWKIYMIIQNPVIHNYEAEGKKDALKSQFENCGLHLYSTRRYFVEPPFTVIMSSGFFLEYVHYSFMYQPF